MSEITKQQIMAYVLRYADDEEAVEEGEEAWVDANVKSIVQGDRQVDGKIAYSCNIYQAGDAFYEVTFTQSNSGYWGDGENYPSEIQEVKPMQVTRTEYVAI